LAFNPVLFFIEDWLELERNNFLQKVCSIFNEDGLLVGQYKTRLTVFPSGTVIKQGAGSGKLMANSPSLYRSFSYDGNGNQIASLPAIREWKQACEDAANGGIIDPEDPVGVPSGLVVASTEYDRGSVSSVPIEATVTIFTKTLAVDEEIYFRHAIFSGCWPASFQVFVDGQQVGVTKYLTWLKYDNEIWFDSANGGILYDNEEVIEIKVKNYGEDLGDFEASIGYVVKGV
jgi:hypothetical protein